MRTSVPNFITPNVLGLLLLFGVLMHISQSAFAQNCTVNAPTGLTITCANPTVQLSASTSIPAPTYLWAGPNGFTSTLPNPIVSAAGNYTVTVTDPSTGCSASAVSVVIKNTNLPVLRVKGGRITCANPTVTLSAESPTPNVIIQWTGPDGFTSSIPNPTISVPGLYRATATNPVNGCVRRDSVFVNQNIRAPRVRATGGVINCIDSTVTLNATSGNDEVTFSWTGPDGFTSTLANPTVSVPGMYYVTGTNPNNGCAGTDSARVRQNINPPPLSVTGATLGCGDSARVTLEATSSNPLVTFSWTGPGNFTSTEPRPVVSLPGNYIVTATNPNNGCTRTDTAVVNQTTPQSITITGDTLTCRDTTVTLSVTPAIPDLSYSWAGPGGFTSTLPNPAVSEPGLYVVTVRDSFSCVSTDSITVIEIVTPPGVRARGGRINCTRNSVIIVATSPTPGVTFFWTGPNGFTSTSPTPEVSVPGIYEVTATNPLNGCTSRDTARVLLNERTPVCEIEVPDSTPPAFSLQRLRATRTGNTTYSWTLTSTDREWRINRGENNPNVVIRTGNPGTQATITLTVTNNNTGCSQRCSVTLTTDIIQPIVSQELNDSFSLFHENPLTNNSAITFISFIDSRVNIEVYSTFGQKVCNLFTGEAKANKEYRFLIQEKNVQEGLYILKYTVDGIAHQTRIIIK